MNQSLWLSRLTAATLVLISRLLGSCGHVWSTVNPETDPLPEFPGQQLIRVQKVLRRLRIYLSKLNEFKDFDTALARFAFREKRMRPFHACRDFPLRQAHCFAGRDQLFDKSVVKSLMMRRPPLAGDSRLRLLLLRHPSSVVNA